MFALVHSAAAESSSEPHAFKTGRLQQAAASQMLIRGRWPFDQAAQSGHSGTALFAAAGFRSGLAEGTGAAKDGNSSDDEPAEPNGSAVLSAT